MTCERDRKDAYRFIDNEMTAETRTNFKRHLAECESCQRNMLKAKGVHDALRTHVALRPATAAAMGGVLERIPETRATDRGVAGSLRRLFGSDRPTLIRAGLAGAVAIALALMVVARTQPDVLPDVQAAFGWIERIRRIFVIPNGGETLDGSLRYFRIPGGGHYSTVGNVAMAGDAPIRIDDEQHLDITITRLISNGEDTFIEASGRLLPPYRYETHVVCSTLMDAAGQVLQSDERGQPWRNPFFGRGS